MEKDRDGCRVVDSEGRKESVILDLGIENLKRKGLVCAKKCTKIHRAYQSCGQLMGKSVLKSHFSD